MHRRRFLALSTSAIALPGAGYAFLDLDYSPAVWRDLRQSDETVVLFFRASWSLTCRIKEDMIADLMAMDPRFETISFVNIDWDTFGQSQMTERLGVKRRSTLIVMKQGNELARLENDTRKEKIRTLLETALRA